MRSAEKCRLAELVDEVGSLAPVAAQIVSMTADPECDTDKLAKVILCDNVMAMRFLALANSAAFCRGQEIRDLRGALMRLGLRRVRNVAFLMGMHDLIPGHAVAGALPMAEFWKHSLATAACAQALAWRSGLPRTEDAWLVGILHGIGVPVLAQRAPREFQQACTLAKTQGLTMAEAEVRVLDFHHGEVGGRILAHWNLPRVFKDAVAYHLQVFDPQEVSPETNQLVGILRQAIGFVRSLGFGDNGDGVPPLPLATQAQVMGLTGPALEALTGKITREVQEMCSLIGLDLPEEAVRAALDHSQRMMAHVGLEGIEDSLAKDRLERQLGLARQIQRHLLPAAAPRIPGYQVAARNIPSQHVSGDTYDFIALPDGRLVIALADVVGDGMPASLLASTLQASIRALTAAFTGPGDLLAAANQALFTSTDPEGFATLFLAAVDPATGSLQYASAGHTPALLLRREGAALWLRPAGTPLGMQPGGSFPVHAAALAPGDVLVAYTDGVTEATDPQGREFGTAGLVRIVRQNRDQSAEGILAALLRGVQTHAGAPGCELMDDLTLVVLKKDD